LFWLGLQLQLSLIVDEAELALIKEIIQVKLIIIEKIVRLPKKQ
jgi:hypothetical protein